MKNFAKGVAIGSALCAAAAIADPADAALICFDDYVDGSVSWHVGDKANPFGGLDPNSAVCDAYGNELAYLQSYFTGMHGRKGKELEGTGIITYRGADAAFIVENL